MDLSALLRHQLLSPSDESVGKVDDVIVRLRGGDLPLVTGLVAKVGGRRVYISDPADRRAERGASGPGEGQGRPPGFRAP